MSQLQKHKERKGEKERKREKAFGNERKRKHKAQPTFWQQILSNSAKGKSREFGSSGKRETTKFAHSIQQSLKCPKSKQKPETLQFIKPNAKQPAMPQQETQPNHRHSIQQIEPNPTREKS